MGLLDLNLPNKHFLPEQFRANFPALNSESVYLDSAATALKPLSMIDATLVYYAQNTATAKRSLYQDALQVTAKIDKARQNVADLVHANSSAEIIWTRGATESINLIAQSYARSLLQPNDEIIVSELEHHSNLLPWLIVAKQTGAKVVKWSSDVNELSSLMSAKTKIVAVTQMSNVTGFCPDLATISNIVHQYDAVLVVDGAQGVVHHAINVNQLDIDFYAFSTHKLYGPTGLGVLYGKKALLELMSVWHGGGKMLKSASFDDFIQEDLPYKFEAGTPNIAGIVGFNSVLEWLKSWDNKQAENYTKQLAYYAKSQLNQFADIQFYSVDDSPIITFNINNIHHNDIAILLSEQNIAIRTGELCAQPLMNKLGCHGAVRVSLMPYNNQQDVEKFISVLQNVIEILV
ncbi:MAG: cysteine desulfurase CsdA [Gilliamella sp.]|uniref:cysteine desulfurase CsdA n=1 Tax=Gilliamella sp. TaxID=1891236 RepID=UPI0025EBEF64|nr:cysteine desulfurase CsdA [Gilliamella sp.]MCO6538853.1 cysteine desulfurase CsdA [Gilliamella sp.]MCO6549763.1 cysteine desulfurase CsdA [Gilliamella sp.]